MSRKQTQIINYRPISFLDNQKISNTDIIINDKKKYFEKQMMIKNVKKPLFPFIFYMSDFFINKSKNQYFCFVSKDYLIIYKFMNRLYDVSSYLMLYKQFNILKNILVKGELLDAVNSIEKLNINNKELVEELNNNSLNNIFLYLSEIILKKKNMI